MPSEIQVAQPSTQLSRPETFAPRTLDEAMRFATILCESGMVPKSYVGKPPATIVVALQFGMELGMQPMQALQNIANINGQPGIWGDAALALVLSSGLCEYYKEDNFKTIGANKEATFVVKRKGFPEEKVTTFSYEMATKAGIIGNAVWKTYPERMCQMRARSFGLRDSFPDILKGMPVAEELQDYNGPTIDAQPSTSTAKPTTASAPPAEETIGQVGGSEFYREYKASGWTPDEAKTWLRDNLQIGPPHNEKNSKDILLKDKQKALDWARSPAPVKLEVTKKFELLGWTTDERKEFFVKHKDFAMVNRELQAVIDDLNKNEQ